ncbi:PTS transporter subunit EIIC [Salisediminibacterium halotolerans]|uniref:PTS system, sucrose-specific IIC component n=1 Tax=Salisediminibacterium halotolerans TaxID=517425 RepID=A0A1H9TWI1_9BACI|nr:MULTISPECIES: PTS transporter subunit EIIC [Salisediminibacterium]RLJ75581.1 PTS system IIB component (Glc family) /PTS system IIC component (Glc family) [Actinophytocola xinjiangensis]RPE89435.1 PTS system IIB component (Glc family) /PTS system IIC component (Glc family) [Salisediminibacterium halotolerans]TWG36194.1 PTS system IIB component (Glc family) /PTS system IIC component (Glc family) [Salisediminibacterium halotolerans]SES01113.1 PTS system, sucrose-specific IIC component [Salisedi
MKKEEQITRDILENVGGKENVQSISHCMTRLRMQFDSYDKVDIEKLKQTDGVMGVVEDETLQIIIGPGTVNKVAAELCRLTGLTLGETKGGEHVAADTKAAVDQKTRTPIKNFLKRIGSIFIPLIPALVASGLINGGASFAQNAGVDPETTWLAILLVIGSGFFTYLGILVGWNTAKEFGGTPALGAIAGILIINPALEDITLFGEQLVPGQGGLFAVLLAGYVMAVVEQAVRKFVPEAVDIIVTPFITVLTVGVGTIIVLQPIGGFIAEGVTLAINGVLDVGGAIAGAILAGTFLPLVMVGMHHGLTPIHLEFIESQGATPLLTILAMAGGGQVGAAMAVFVKTNNKKLKNNIKGALPVGFLGIGEPLLYGVTLPLGRPFLTACLGSAVAGAFQAVMSTAALGIGVSGLSLIPLIADNDYVWYFLGLVIAYTFGFIFTYLFGFKEEMAKNIG